MIDHRKPEFAELLLRDFDAQDAGIKIHGPIEFVDRHVDPYHAVTFGIEIAHGPALKCGSIWSVGRPPERVSSPNGVRPANKIGFRRVGRVHTLTLSGQVTLEKGFP